MTNDTNQPTAYGDLSRAQLETRLAAAEAVCIMERVAQAIIAADEAAGIRRVTSEELDQRLEQARTEERQRLIGEFAKAARVSYKATGESDAQRLLEVASRISGGYPVGGSNTTITVARLLRFVAGFISVQDFPVAAESPAGGVS